MQVQYHVADVDEVLTLGVGIGLNVYEYDMITSVRTRPACDHGHVQASCAPGVSSPGLVARGEGSSVPAH